MSNTKEAQARRVRRLKINAAAWGLGTILILSLWAAFSVDWNPTLPAVAIGLWGLVVGIMALRVHFERPVTAGNESARRHLERVQRLRFHAAAWVLGMVVLAPLNALIEWQDNGAFERVSRDSQPGSWDPWILYVGGIWAAVIALFALWVYMERPRRGVSGGTGALKPG